MRRRTPAVDLLVRPGARLGACPGHHLVGHPLDQLIDDGLIFLDKPDGYVCHDISTMVKEMLASKNVAKVGHGGTLDPNATGVLPLALGSATRIQDVLLSGSKEYVGIMHVHGDPGEQRVREIARTFVGEIAQVPPDRSAVSRTPRARRVDALNVLEVDGRDVLFKVSCEAGTYIRTLCVDMGKSLGCGAHLTALRRTRSGSFSEDDDGLATLPGLYDAIRRWLEERDGDPLQGLIHPVERAFSEFPRVVVRHSAVRAISRGQGVRCDDVVALDHNLEKGDAVAIFDQDAGIIARGKMLVPTGRAFDHGVGFVARTVKVYKKAGGHRPV